MMTVDVDKKSFTVALVGNPNCGKTSVFNGLVGARAHVGNYPGVTVEKRSATLTRGGLQIEFVDLPGVYSLSAATLDERIARKFILHNKPDLVVNVIDTGNLERNLYLTAQVMEMGVPMLFVLNMWDEAQKQGIVVNEEKLSRMLGGPLVKTVAHKGEGVKDLLDLTVKFLQDREAMVTFAPRVKYGGEIDRQIAAITRTVGSTSCNTLPPRWYAVNLLENTVNIDDFAKPTVEERELIFSQVADSKNRIKKQMGHESDTAITDARYRYIGDVLDTAVNRGRDNRMQFSNRLDSILTHKYFGYPIFLFFMWLIFQATFMIGQYPAEWIDTGVGVLQGLVSGLLPAGVLNDLITDGMIGGMGAVLVFLPNIMILYLGIAVMEDSGYMSRAAFMTDRFMRVLGLNGKAFIPLLMGFGCNVPAIMATRTLESHRDRVLAVLIIPFMSCSARLSVYVLFCGAFFAGHAGNVIFSLYLLGIAVAVGFGRLLKHSLFKDDTAPFFMEFPPYRRPTFKAGLLMMWERAKIYLGKIGGVILVASIVIWFLGAFPRIDSYSQDYDTQIAQLQQQPTEAAGEQIVHLQSQMKIEEIQHSYIGRLGNLIQPIIEPLGFNWQMGIALITGFVAKEIVVSTLGVLYQLGEDVDESSTSLMTIISDPSGGISPLVAYAFLVFVLLYTPCLTVMAAMKREIGAKWMWFGMSVQLVIPWIVAFAIYRIGMLIGM